MSSARNHSGSALDRAGGGPDGERFAFGHNWRRFLATVDEERVRASMGALQVMLGRDDLAGIRFLDIGSGSGLSSAAAYRLGAKVHSFDYDEQAVECTRELRRRFADGDAEWQIEQGSALDGAFLERLGTFDVVYSWGVLHHTGAMHEAMANAAGLVASDGQLFIALYNDQGRTSDRWRRIKRMYVRSSRPVRAVLVAAVGIRIWGRTVAKDALRGRPLRTWRQPRRRGMSAYHDLVDWVGGYPFEVARPDDVMAFYAQQGFALERSHLPLGLACNEFVFRRKSSE